MADSLPQAIAALFNPQHNRLLRLAFPNDDGPSSLLVVDRLDAAEGLSQDFRFVVQLLSQDAYIPSKDLIGKLATIELVRKDGSLRHFNGYVFEFRKLRADGGQAYYEMVLGPWLAFLKLRRDNYLFHGKTVLDQTAEIFGDYEQRDYEARVGAMPDPAITQAMQWDESDYNYLHRRWESRGWYYYYEHRADGHTLVLCDDSLNADPVDGDPLVRFHDHGGPEEEDAIADWSPIRLLSPTQVAVTSYDFKNPTPLTASTNTLNQQGDVPALEVYEHTGAYGFRTTDDGEQLAKLRMEEMEAQAKRFDGGGNCKRLQPGRWFEMIGHYEHDAGNAEERQFLVVEMRHSAANNYQHTGGAGHYANQVTAVRKKIPWRPGRNMNSAEPKIYGVLTATVVGPAGDEIHTDEYGRVRVQFHFDREGQYDEKASCWVRVASVWAGERFGFMSIPRIGQEVLVQFLGGNPDMPIVTGRVYNQANMPPWDLPANKTQTGILTRSSTGGGYDNANAIRFEDKQGDEQLWIHAEKNQDIEVENDETHWVGNDRTKTIDRDETVYVKRDRTETVDRDENITIHNNREERVDHDERISIGDNRTEDVGKNETLYIGDNRTKTVGKSERYHIGKNKTINIGRFKTETIGMASLQTVGMGKMTNVGLGYNRNVGMMMISVVGLNRTDQIGKTWSMTAGDKIELKVGSSMLTLTPDAIYLSAKDIHLKAENEVHVDAPKDVHLNNGAAQPPPDFSGQGGTIAGVAGAAVGVAGLLGNKGDDHKRVKEENAKQATPDGSTSGVLDRQPPPPAAQGNPMPPITAKGTADASDVALVEAELNKMPEQFRQQLLDNGAEVVVVRNSVTEHYTELQGVRPRGWPPGTSWDSVPGMARDKTIVIATRGHGTAAGAHVPLAGNGHGSYNLALHESAHALRRITGDSPEFLAARTADLGALDAYQTQAGDAGLSETFAESFANVFGGNPNYSATHPNLYDYWLDQVGGP